MTAETETCQNCKSQFIIEPEDFQFYEKIKVPAPTFCPECRAIRRMTWRNERSLYKRKCAATGKEVISMFAPETPVVVYERDYWWSDNWDQLASGREYDFSKPFFVQFSELLKSAPLPNLAINNCPGSEYGNHNVDCKNCYLIYASIWNENVSYSRGAVECKDSFDLDTGMKIEQSSNDILSGSLYRVHFSYDTDESLNSEFLQACKNVTNSLGCINLHNKSHHIFNKPYSKEEYEIERKKYDLGSLRALQEFKKKFREFILQHPRRFAFVVQSVDTTGDNIINAKNCKDSFDVFGEVENARYVAHAKSLKDAYDGYGVGMGELIYEAVDTGLNLSRTKFNIFTHTSHDAEYTYACHGSSYLFGCIGLRSKTHCILNKQYTKEEYEKLVPRIIKHMNEMPYISEVRSGKSEVRKIEYRYGEFFPTEISPFAYNETLAQEFFPISKVEVEAKGYRWYETKGQNYGITTKTEDIPDHIKDASDNILKEIIECAHKGACNEKCTKAFRVINSELQFYRQMNIALPRLCPNCRHFERLAFRNPMKLWHRRCMCSGTKSEKQPKTSHEYENTIRHFHGADHCPNEFETAYAPEKIEILYCQKCYNAEVV